jgi:hypothetical protein
MKTLLAKCIDEDYGITGNGRWYRSKEKSSLVYDAERDLFFYNKDQINGDIFIYLTKIRGWSFQQAKEYLKCNNFTGTFIHEIKEGSETIVYPKLVEVFHQNLLEGDKTYFYNRLITDETIHRFQLGFYNGYYSIPIFIDGTLKQIQLRRDSPKLITNFYSNVGPLLFNVDVLKFTNKIIITEGIIGSILLMQAGIPSVSMNIGAEGFQPQWIKYFATQKEITILFDRDSAGDKGAIHTAKILGVDRCRIYNMFHTDTKGFAVDDYLLDGYTVAQLFELVETGAKHVYELETPTPKYRGYNR